MKFLEVNDGLLKLRPFTMRDLTDEYISWLNDSATVRYSEQRHMVHTYESCLKYYEHRLSCEAPFLAIKLNDSNETHIGNIGIDYDRFNNVADLSIIIGRKDCRGKGYGYAAWNLAIESLLNLMDVRMVTAGTMESNISMIRLMQKSKMQFQGTINKRFLHEGQEVGLVIASKTKRG